MEPVLACALLAGLAVLLAQPDAVRRRLRVVARPRPTGHGDQEAVPPSAGPPLAAADVAVLADQLAALAIAGLPSHRIWAAVTEHGASPSARAAAAAVVAAQRHGLGPAEAFRAYLSSGASRRPRRLITRLARRGRGDDPAAVHLAVALDVSERTGAGAAPTLHRFAEVLRADERAAQERAAALAGPQATAAVLSALPLAGLLLGAAVGGRPWHALLATAAGRWCLVLGGAFWIAGRRWTGHLVRRAARPQ